MALIDTPEAANRLARAIASDISLYNEEKIEEGIRNDDLFDVLDNEIEDGLTLYKRRISPEMPTAGRIFKIYPRKQESSIGVEAKILPNHL